MKSTKILSITLVMLMALSTLGVITFNAAPESVTGPFADKSQNYPTWTYEKDQYSESAADLDMIQVNECHAQTFTPGITGILSHVVVGLQGAGPGSTTDYITCEIRTTTGAIPDGPAGIIASSTKMVTLESGSYSWVAFGFSSLPVVASGVTYAIVFTFTGYDFWWWWDVTGYGGGANHHSVDNGNTWGGPGGDDYVFQTYIRLPSDGLSKVAWHASGDYAICVSGSDEYVYKFIRQTGKWEYVFQASPVDVFNDVVYDPAFDQFYLVGESNTWPFAYAWSEGGGPVDLHSPISNGAFYAAEPCDGYNDGSNDYYFLAVGQDSLGHSYAAWYTPTPLLEADRWIEVNTGMVPNDLLTDVTWDYKTKFYAVGYDTVNYYGVGYMFGLPGTTTMTKLIGGNPDYGMLNAIDWCPKWSDGAMYDYCLVVGNYYGGCVGNIFSYRGSGNPLGGIYKDISNYYDIDWYPDGKIAVVVGEHGGNPVVLNHLVGTPKLVDVSDLLPAGLGQLYGVACKGPTSPASAIILGTGGAVAAFPQAQDIGTQIRVNAAFPHIFAIDMWDTATAVGLSGPSLLNTEVDPGEVYTFFIEANYTLGGVENWINAEIELAAWYDGGAVGAGSVPLDGSWTADNRRTQQFRIVYNVGAGAAVLAYPTGVPLEFDVASWYEDPNPVAIDHHRLYINVSFGIQTYAADGNGFTFGPSGDILQNAQLFDANSWDFNYSVYDATLPDAKEEAYEEFGIKQAVSISVAGNPTGNAPPGSSNVALSPFSTITYSANSLNWVNVSLPDLLLNGLGPDNIPAGNVDVLNSNTWNTTDSDISAWTAMPGAGSYVCVWGHAGPSVPLAPVQNGTQSAARVSDFTWNTYGTYPDWTSLQWRVTVPTIPEGVYWATITFTVESI